MGPLPLCPCAWLYEDALICSIWYPRTTVFCNLYHMLSHFMLFICLLCLDWFHNENVFKWELYCKLHCYNFLLAWGLLRLTLLPEVWCRAAIWMKSVQDWRTHITYWLLAGAIHSQRPSSSIFRDLLWRPASCFMENMRRVPCDKLCRKEQIGCPEETPHKAHLSDTCLITGSRERRRSLS